MLGQVEHIREHLALGLCAMLGLLGLLVFWAMLDHTLGPLALVL